MEPTLPKKDLTPSKDVDKVTPMTYRAALSQIIGYLFDSYDLTIVVSLATVLNTVFLPKQIPPLLSSIAVLSGFVLSEVVRPLGSAFFGNYGDKIGRKSVLIITVVGYSISAALVAALPNYATAGYLGFVLYLVLRFVVGFFVGGEYAGGHSMAMEWTPPKWRGLVSGLILAGFILGSALSALAVFLFTTTYGSDAFASFGWRYAILTTLIPMPVAIFIRIGLKDPPQFEELKKKGALEKTPLASIFKGPALKDFLQIMLLMTGMFLCSFSSFTNELLVLQSKPSILSYPSALLIYISGLIGGAVGAITFGHLSQLIGRRKLGTRWHFATIILAIPLYYGIILAASNYNVLLAYALSFLLVFLAYAPWGATPAYLAERYKTSHRASGVGFGFSSGLLIGGWYTFYTLGLHYLFTGIEGANIWLSTSVLLIIGATLVIIGYALGPETRGISLAR
jgi:MHS family proline/betaine transporter-like MFS transporter